MSEHPPSVRQRLHAQLEPPSTVGAVGLSRVNGAIAITIVLASLTAILESEPTLRRGNEGLFFALEGLFTLIFLVEYAARLWVAGEDARYQGWQGRLRYALTPSALLDLVALMPFFLVALGTEGFLLRVLRLVRILRIARLGRFTRALTLIQEAVAERRFELMMSIAIAGFLLIISSTLLYIAESHAQPETFGSIPRAMWWSIATLTTVGYGDAYPVTAIGRVLAGLTAIAGIGIIAMPTGILAAAFSDAVQREHDLRNGPDDRN